MSGPLLAGRRVVVTRARAQASDLVERLAALGATVVELPVIAIEDPEDGGAALAAAADRLVVGGYGWVACTSTNAVHRLLAAVGDRPVPSSVKWAAVGTGTARALADAGVPADLVPGESVAEALAQAFPTAGAESADGPAGADGDAALTVLFPRAASVRSALVDGLTAKGWRVDQVVTYRTVTGAPGDAALAAAGAAEAVAFTSSSTVTRTVELLGVAGIPPVVVTIGPVTSDTARRAGLRVAAEASPHTIDGLVAAVVGALGDAPAGGGAAATGPAGSPSPGGDPPHLS